MEDQYAILCNEYSIHNYHSLVSLWTNCRTLIVDVIRVFRTCLNTETHTGEWLLPHFALLYHKSSQRAENTAPWGAHSINRWLWIWPGRADPNCMETSTRSASLGCTSISHLNGNIPCCNGPSTPKLIKEICWNISREGTPGIQQQFSPRSLLTLTHFLNKPPLV